MQQVFSTYNVQSVKKVMLDKQSLSLSCSTFFTDCMYYLLFWVVFTSIFVPNVANLKGLTKE